jgi:hypothetical protein
MTTIPDSGSTPHEDNAQAIRLDLTRLVQGIRGFTLLTPEQRRKYNVSGHVDDDFLRNIALLLDANSDVSGPSRLTGAEIREHLQFSGSYHGVGKELRLHGRMTDDTLLAERASIGERALRALKIARDINTPAGRDSLVPHLEAIDQEFSRGRRRRPPVKKPEESAAAKAKTEVKP